MENRVTENEVSGESQIYYMPHHMVTHKDENSF